LKRFLILVEKKIGGMGLDESALEAPTVNGTGKQKA